MIFTGYLYCISSDHTDKYGIKKLGFTTDPIKRMVTYSTGDAPGTGMEKRYDGIWKTTALSKEELRSFESSLHLHFISKQQYKGTIPTEWFAVSFEDVQTYLNSQTFIESQLSIDDINIIHKKVECKILGIEYKSPTLKDEFFNTFLPIGGAPRRIQNELWDLFENICNSGDKYKGIVQWATGTGKTIALLMLFVISAAKIKRDGGLFRGLLISPKNDIFDTILCHIKKLSKWGIIVCEGHNARLSSLHIPVDSHVLITATHASLTDGLIWDKLPQITHCHYDEVHRVTGEEFYTLLNSKIAEWNTCYLTGTSATPRTCSIMQHKKLMDLFGSPLNVLHKCEIDEAVEEGWIAKPRFVVNVSSNTHSRIEIIRGFIQTLDKSIRDKMAKDLWNGGKVIAYLPLRDEVRVAVTLAKELMPDCIIYSAVEDTEAIADDTFISDEADGYPRVLFACERYREGSDIRGIEMTTILMGNTIGANILLQIAGRALRSDYPGKEGWCVIVRPSDDSVNEDEVFDDIVLLVMEYIGKDNGCTMSRDVIRHVVIKFFGEVTISGKIYDIEETIDRIQALYMRKTFERGAIKEKYAMIQQINQSMGLTCKKEYYERASEHPKYIENPQIYFKDWWVSWCHYLGIDISTYPKTLVEWRNVCKELGILTWDDYKLRAETEKLPLNPADVYVDYTNWEKEFVDDTNEYIW